MCWNRPWQYTAAIDRMLCQVAEHFCISMQGGMLQQKCFSKHDGVNLNGNEQYRLKTNYRWTVACGMKKYAEWGKL